MVTQDVRQFMDDEDIRDELMESEAIKAKAKFATFGTTEDELLSKKGY